ncbi:hypothetical protein K501DRAFT_267483 [Backusella circina FSU 941]|nr:hypothetical protein K501DRAFT_267483 [Backusella circina FSU 941]
MIKVSKFKFSETWKDADQDVGVYVDTVETVTSMGTNKIRREFMARGRGCVGIVAFAEITTKKVEDTMEKTEPETEGPDRPGQLRVGVRLDVTIGIVGPSVGKVTTIVTVVVTITTVGCFVAIIIRISEQKMVTEKGLIVTMKEEGAIEVEKETVTNTETCDEGKETVTD